MQRYQSELAMAYLRGLSSQGKLSNFPQSLLEEPVTEEKFHRLLELADRQELRMYHFKKKDILPRVHKVLSFLKAVQPDSILDVGSGRGVFLFPFLEQFPWAQATSLDLLSYRVEMLRAISLGGYSQLTPLQGDICTFDAPPKSYHTVTLLEVLEHIPNVQQAISNGVRLAKNYVVVSVPSKEDNNPEHIHLLTKDILTDYFTAAGCKKLRFDGVNGHLILIATVEE